MLSHPRHHPAAASFSVVEVGDEPAGVPERSPRGGLFTRRRDNLAALRHRLRPSLSLLLFILLVASLALRPFGCLSSLQPMLALRSDRPDPRLPSAVVVAGATGLRDLVIVACHSVWQGGPGTSLDRPENADAWVWEPYQRGVPGQADSLIDHMRAGVTAVAANADALLLFSGGATRLAAGPLTEAASYWAVTNAASWFGEAVAVKGRAHVEEHARDSMENLLFGLCRFREITGRYPRTTSLVSYDVKEARFRDMHAASLRLPLDAFKFVGTKAPNQEAAEAGEAATRAMWDADPWGCGGTLGAKRAARDPFARGNPYGRGCPEMASLLEFCGPGPFTGDLPW